MFATPILFLIFNRPDVTAQVFAEIRKQKPKYLFIAADGARTEKQGELEKCEQTQKLVLEAIDWDCELKTLFRETNLGCGKAVSEAITWFFNNVEQGIILEDDCLPNESFFMYCAELLDKYHGDEKIMSISGSNLLGRPWNKNGYSYFYGLGGIWGWATWKRAWQLYDYRMNEWTDLNTKKNIKKALQTEDWFNFYSIMFDETYNGNIDTWDAQWLYTILKKGGFSINPSVNLVKNIGFGADATHTHDSNNSIQKLEAYPINFPLKHVKGKKIDVQYLKLMYKSINSQRQRPSHLLSKIINNCVKILFLWKK